MSTGERVTLESMRGLLLSGAPSSRLRGKDREKVADLAIEQYEVFDREVSRWGEKEGVKKYREHLSEVYRERYGFPPLLFFIFSWALRALLEAIISNLLQYWLSHMSEAPATFQRLSLQLKQEDNA